MIKQNKLPVETQIENSGRDWYVKPKKKVTSGKHIKKDQAKIKGPKPKGNFNFIPNKSVNTSLSEKATVPRIQSVYKTHNRSISIKETLDIVAFSPEVDSTRLSKNPSNTKTSPKTIEFTLNQEPYNTTDERPHLKTK